MNVGFARILSIIAVASVTGCSIDPKVGIDKITSGDSTGAIKFQLRSSIIQISTETKYIDGELVDSDLKMTVISAPYKENTYALSSTSNVIQDTTINAVHVPKTKLLKTLSVNTKDKLEERIKTTASVIGGAAGLFLSPDDNQIANIRDQRKLVAADFGKWAIDLRTTMKSGLQYEENMLRGNFTDRAGNIWVFNITIGEPSATGINEENLSLSDLGSKGIVFYSSCRDVEVELKQRNHTFRFSDVIAEPRRPETVKLPDKGSVNFGDCSVDVVEEEIIERDVLKLLSTTLTEAEGIAKKLDSDNETSN